MIDLLHNTVSDQVTGANPLYVMEKSHVPQCIRCDREG
jgi:hypothetical protein